MHGCSFLSLYMFPFCDAYVFSSSFFPSIRTTFTFSDRVLSILNPRSDLIHWQAFDDRKYDKTLVGSRIRVWWPLDKR